MKPTNKPIRIAFPSESHIGDQMRSDFLRTGLMSLRSENREVFPLSGFPVECITLNAHEALQLFSQKKVDAVINGDDVCTDKLLGNRMRLRGNAANSSGFDRFMILEKDGDSVIERIPKEGVSKRLLPGIAVPLQVVTRLGDEPKTLEQISRRGDILTDFPFLTRRLLAEKFSGNKVGRIKKVSGDTLPQLVAGLAPSATHSGVFHAHPEADKLMLHEVLFHSHPVVLANDGSLHENVHLRRAIVHICRDLTQNQVRQRSVDSFIEDLRTSTMGRLGQLIGR